MKLFVKILIGLLLVIAVVLALALTPAVQTWAARKALADQPGLAVDFSRVKAGFSSADVQNLRYEKDGIVLTASHAAARYSAWDYLTKQRVTVHDLAVDGLVIDVRNPRPPASAAATSPAPKTAPRSQAASAAQSAAKDRSAPTDAADAAAKFQGLLSQARLPVDLNLARFSIPGRALLPADQTATFELSGQDLRTGQEGTVTWKVEITHPGAGAAYRTARSEGTATVRIATDRRIDRIDVNGTLLTVGPKLPSDPLKLAVHAEQPTAGGDETFAATLTLAPAAEPLLRVAGRYQAAARELSGDWSVAIDEKMGALLPAFGAPELTAKGSGRFAAQPDAGAARTTGQLDALLPRPESLAPQLAAVGALAMRLNFEGEMDRQAAQLTQATAEVTTADGRKLAELRTLQRVGFSQADKRVTFADASSDLARVQLNALPLAWAQAFLPDLGIESGAASMTLAVAATPDGSRVRLTPVEPLTLRDVTITKAGQKLADRLNLSVRPQAEYSKERIHAQLADLQVSVAGGDQLAGRIELEVEDPTGPQPTVRFLTDTRARVVGSFLPGARLPTGPLQVTTKSEGRLAGDELAFTSSITQVAPENGPALLTAELVQPLGLNLKTNAVKVDAPENLTLRLNLGQIPLALLEAFMPESRFAGQVVGGTVGVQVRSLTDVVVSTTEAVTVRGISAALHGQPTLSEVDVTLDFSARKNGEILAYEVRRVEARQGNATLLALSAAGDLNPGSATAASDARASSDAQASKTAAGPFSLTAKGRFQADLGALAQQPALTSANSLAKGVVDGEFDATLRDSLQATARIVARDLVAKEGNRPLGTALLEASATVQPDGSSLLRVPFTLTAGERRSDLTLDGRMSRAADVFSFTGRISSTRLFVDDVKVLAALTPSTPEPPKSEVPARPGVPGAVTGGAPRPPETQGTGLPRGSTTTPTAPRADPKAFWAMAEGRIDLEMREIIYGRDYPITDVRGAATLAPRQLALQDLNGKLQGNPFHLAATIDFAPQQPKPYTLAATTQVQQFDIGAFLRAGDPGSAPKLEGIVNVDGTFQGHGATLTELAKNAYGRFNVVGQQGVLRMLARNDDSALGGLGGIAQGAAVLGGLLGQSKNRPEVAVISQLVGKLAELPYDRFSMQVERGADLGLKMSNIEFLSPDTIITGVGGIVAQEGIPAAQQPMQFTLQLAARGPMAEALDQLKLLKGEADPHGFRAMSRTFQLKGSASKPDSKDLWRSILEAAMGSAPVQNLLNRALGG